MAVQSLYRRLAATGMATACAISIEAFLSTATMSAPSANDGKNVVGAAVQTAPEGLQWQSAVTAARANNCANSQWSSSLRQSDARDAAGDGCEAAGERLDAPKGAPKASRNTPLFQRSRHKALF